MLVLVADLSFVGYTAGNRWLYDYLFEDTLHQFYMHDTLTQVVSWDGSGSRCSFSSPVDRAVHILNDYPAFSFAETTYAHYDGTYLVDFVGSTVFYPFSGAGIRTLKFPLTVGEEWQAIDTCIYALGEKVPHPKGSIDADTITDTLWYDTSYASLTRYVGDTLVVSLSPIRFNTKVTDLLYLDDTTYICCRTYYYAHFGRVEYIANFGMSLLRIDSTVVDISYGLINTNTWDTTFIPRSYFETLNSSIVIRYVGTSIAEKPSEGQVRTFTLRGRTLVAEESMTIYGTDGRLVSRLGERQRIRLKPGIYFVRTAGGTARVVIR